MTKINMTKRKIIILTTIGFLIIFCAYRGFFQKEEPTFVLTEVTRGDIFEEVSETGQIKKGEELNLSFKQSGKIEEIYVKTGDNVKEGQLLVKLDTVQLEIQLQEAKAALSMAQANLDKLLTGARPEQIQAAKTAVLNAQTALENAIQSLKDIESQAKESLNAAYEDSLSILDSSYLKAYNAFNVVTLIQRTYFTGSTAMDEESIKVRDNKDKIETAVSSIKSYLDIAKNENIYSAKNEISNGVDIALSETEKLLTDISNALKIIRETCEESHYRNIVPSTAKSSLDAQRESLNAVLSNIINCRQMISSTKLANQANINAAKAKVSQAEGALKIAENELNLLIAPPRQEDIVLYRAQVEQAKARVRLLEKQIEESVLKSPIFGQVARINKKIGELVQPTLTDVIIVLIPEAPFYVEANVPEVDIGKISLGDPCKITLDAIPEENFSGKVIEIDPAQTVISGVVYYKIKISLETEDRKIKPGMTANIIIITDSRENVLMVPQRAVIEKDGKKIVRIPIDNTTFQEVEIKTGLRGSGGEVEIISGPLNEGDKIITFLKEK